MHLIFKCIFVIFAVIQILRAADREKYQIKVNRDLLTTPPTQEQTGEIDINMLAEMLQHSDTLSGDWKLRGKTLKLSDSKWTLETSYNRDDYASSWPINLLVTIAQTTSDINGLRHKYQALNTLGRIKKIEEYYPSQESDFFSTVFDFQGYSVRYKLDDGEDKLVYLVKCVELSYPVTLKHEYEDKKKPKTFTLSSEEIRKDLIHQVNIMKELREHHLVQSNFTPASFARGSNGKLRLLDFSGTVDINTDLSLRCSYSFAPHYFLDAVLANTSGTLKAYYSVDVEQFILGILYLKKYNIAVQTKNQPDDIKQHILKVLSLRRDVIKQVVLSEDVVGEDQKELYTLSILVEVLVHLETRRNVNYNRLEMIFSNYGSHTDNAASMIVPAYD